MIETEILLPGHSTSVLTVLRGALARLLTRVGVGSLVLVMVHAAPASARPNVMIIIADDLGWKDVGYNGSEISTPNIDRLATDGIELQRYYSQPTCSPTRASLMTGLSAPRTGVLQPIDKNLQSGLPRSLKLMPEYFQDAGYRTALMGKWHLGHAFADQLPNARGFDTSYGNLLGGIGYWDHVHGGGLDWHRDGQTLREEGYVTHLLSREITSYLSDAESSTPFFLVASFTAPHKPNEAPADTVQRYRQLDNPQRRTHAAMVDELDQAIGQVLQALEDARLSDNTLVWFISDNGGLLPGAIFPQLQPVLERLSQWFPPPWNTDTFEFMRSNIMDGGSDNGPFRRGKGSIYEGGIRVPSAIYWPGTIAAQTLDQRVTVQDVMPTVLQAAGITLPGSTTLDGSSRWQAVVTGEPFDPTDFVANGFDGQAYLQGDWKLVVRGTGDEELYQLDNDPTEAHNVIDQNAAITSELREKLKRHPRGESIHHNSMLDIVLDPDTFGGQEVQQPWADAVRSPDMR